MHSNKNFFGISWYFFFPLEEIPIEVAVSRAHKGISFSHWEKYLTWRNAIACARVCNLWIFACKLGRTVVFSTACAHHPFDVQDWSCPWHRTVASQNMLLRFCLVTKQLTLHYFLSPTVVRYYIPKLVDTDLILLIWSCGMSHLI